MMRREAVDAGVSEREGHRSKGLAATSGDGEGKEAGGQGGAVEGGVEDAVTQRG